MIVLFRLFTVFINYYFCFSFLNLILIICCCDLKNKLGGMAGGCGLKLLSACIIHVIITIICCCCCYYYYY